VKQPPKPKGNPDCTPRVLRLEIRATDKFCCTWWPDDMHRCPQIMMNSKGNLFCGAFGGARLYPDPSDGSKGFTMRCQECLDAEGVSR
jgi:hypothetical protein